MSGGGAVRWLHADGTLRPNDFYSAMKSPRLFLGGGGAAVLGGVSGLHLYWSAGGRRGQDAVVPTSDGRTLIAPSKAATVPSPRRWRWPARFRRCDGTMGAALGVPRGATGVAAVLAARAIGDRRYVGFLKRSRGSAFPRRDTYLYSPLCAILAVAGAAVSA